jgi:hypothetical protein
MRKEKKRKKMKKDWDILTPGRQSRWKSEREMGTPCQK